ncbi:MAG: hypothetical protein SFU98_03745 [Leptospiraceae bacterium]|nr:hypothetical protein [Leptospiraceae bacterium]
MKLFLSLLFFFNSIWAEPNFKIDEFNVLDSSQGIFWMIISGEESEKICDLLKTQEEGKFEILINNSKAEIYRSTVRKETDNNTYKFYLSVGQRFVRTGNAKAELFQVQKNQRTFHDQMEIKLKESGGAEEQPVILRMNPAGGVAGDTVTILGKNFGKKLDDISIHFYDIQKDTLIDLDYYDEPTTIRNNVIEENSCDIAYIDDDKTPFVIRKEMGSFPPLTLGLPNKEGVQEITFAIPNELREFTNGFFIRRNIQMRAIVNGRPTKLFVMTLLPDNWTAKVLSFTIIFTLIGWGIIAILVKRWNFLPSLLIDKSINAYSLARFQALIWTGVLTTSYFYIAFCSGILMRNGEMPDFNASLIALMGISYTGLLSSHFLSRKNPENVLRNLPPRISDLISTNGEVDMAKVQLFIFTLVSVTVYVYNLYYHNALKGLPDIPPTLHGLLLTSQSGYIGAKMIKEKISVNQVIPQMIPTNHTEIRIQLVGSGFKEGIQVSFDESSIVETKTKVLSPTLLEVSFVNDGKSGTRSLVVIPPQGSSFTIHNAIQVGENIEENNS